MAARIIMYPEKRKSDPNRSARRPDTWLRRTHGTSEKCFKSGPQVCIYVLLNHYLFCINEGRIAAPGGGESSSNSISDRRVRL